MEESKGASMFEKHSKSFTKEQVRKLVIKVKKNDTEAFIQLLGCFSHTIATLARSFNLPMSEYEDLCQEGRIALYRAASGYDGKTAEFSTYASTCITNAMITFASKYNSSVSHTAFAPLNSEDGENDNHKSSDNTEDTVIAEEFSRMLSTDGFAGLSGYEREVIELKLSGHMTRDIAKKLGKSAKSIDNTLFRARKKLREHIDR